MPDNRTVSAGARAREPLPWEARFFEVFRLTGNASEAARAAGVARASVYEARERHPDLAAEWLDAEDEARDALKAEARRRAVDGTLKPVFQGGAEVGQIREYSDTLLLALLKARCPEFRDSTKHEHSGPGGGPIRMTWQDVVKLAGEAERDGDAQPD